MFLNTSSHSVNTATASATTSNGPRRSMESRSRASDTRTRASDHDDETNGSGVLRHSSGSSGRSDSAISSGTHNNISSSEEGGEGTESLSHMPLGRRIHSTWTNFSWRKTLGMAPRQRIGET